MTQDVQPLTWQKRTNLEEHQQFFSKINEIIANLAPTVDEAEQAIAQATQAITNANAAIATANAASAAADAAAQQAQTAANTVAGYNTRLIAVEDESAASASNIVDLQDRMGTAEGNITALGTRMTAAESKNNQQDTAITALQTADANNVKISGTHAIGDYAVLLTGNQTKRGQLTFAEYVVHPMQKADFAINQSSNTPWVKLFEIPTARRQVRGKFVGTSAQAFFVIDNGSNTAPVVRIGGWGLTGSDWIAATYNEGDSKIGVWFKTPNYASEKIFIEEIGNYGGTSTYDYITVVQNPEYVALPTGDYVTYSTVWAAIQ